MSSIDFSYEKILLEKIKEGDKSSYAILFDRYYRDLVTFSFGLVKSLTAAEEIAQEVFIRLWEDRHSLQIEKSLKSFLLKSVQNRSLNWLQHNKVVAEYELYVKKYFVLSDNETEKYILHSELQGKLTEALEKIPKEYADAFCKNRFENHSYVEIAQACGVSVRTIEVRISKALKLLREELRDFLLLLIFFISL